jgi:cellulose synthase/poly-beta-1,6-N-acetylglucosamine synthase-like glycosyltransferase
MNMDVVICAKNQAKLMDRVLHQIVRNIPFKNLIVIYGTSMDETKKTAEKYTNKVFWDGDKGLGAARNLGIKKATSEIVTMFDADIILTKGWHQQLIKHFQNPDVAAVMGTCIYGYGCKPLESFHEYTRRTFVGANWGCQNTMFRREAVLKVGNFNETIKGAGEDYDLYLRLLQAGYKWIWVREATVYHPLSMSEYLKHCQWWAQGRPYMDEVFQQLMTISLFRFYRRQALSILQDFKTAIKLSVFVHPTFLLYYPAIKITSVFELLKELKKALVYNYRRNKTSL